MPVLAARLLLFTVLVTLGAVPPAPANDVLVRVERGLEAADPDAVLAASSDRVEIVLDGQGGVFRQAQASHVLRDFFRRHPPERVEFSEPSASDDGQTATGRYYTRAGGAPLSLRVMIRDDGGAWVLASLRIDQRSAVRPNGP